MNFEYAKENMVKQQILTAGVQLGALIDAILAVPREDFLPTELKSLAYSDSNLEIKGRLVRSPMLMARILDALNVKSSDKVLKLGLESGYVTAVIAQLVQSVEVLDYSEEELQESAKVIKNLNIDNVEHASVEKLADYIANNEQFDCIYISNEVEDGEVEESLLGLLKVGGKMTFTVKKPDFSKVYIVTKTSDDSFDKKFLFDVYNK